MPNSSDSFSTKPKRKLLQEFFSNASYYGVGVIVPRAGELILIPIYWAVMSPADFGIIGFAQMIILVLSSLLNLGFFEAVQRLYHEWSPEERPRYLAAIWACSTSLSLVTCALLGWFGERIFPLLLSQVAFDPYLRIAVWSALFANLAMLPFGILRARAESKRYAKIAIVSFVTQACISLYLVVILDMRAEGYLLGSLAGNVMLAAYLTLITRSEMRFSMETRHLREPLRYSLPMVPTAIIDNVGSMFDRLFLDRYVSLSNIGLYNLGKQFGAAFNLFHIVMKNSWLPLVYRIVSVRADGPEVISRIAVYYVAFLTIPALAVALLSKELIVWFGGDTYRAVYGFVPYFVLMFYIQSLGMALGRGIDLSKRTSYNLLVSTVTLVAGFLLLWTLIPRYGVWGGVAGTLLAALIRNALTIVLGHALYPRPFLGGKYLQIFLFAGLAFYSGFKVDTGAILLDGLIKMALVAACAAAIAWFSLDRDKWIPLLRQVLRQRTLRVH